MSGKRRRLSGVEHLDQGKLEITVSRVVCFDSLAHAGVGPLGPTEYSYLTVLYENPEVEPRGGRVTAGTKKKSILPMEQYLSSGVGSARVVFNEQLSVRRIVYPHFFEKRQPTVRMERILIGVALLAVLVVQPSESLLSLKPANHQRVFSPRPLAAGQPTELPDSLEDAAVRAAEATAQFAEQIGARGRCRVDFDTSIGDETYTILKTSTEFMQNFVSALSYALIPGLQAARQAEVMRVASARAELKALEDSEDVDESTEEELVKIVSSGGRDELEQWEGPVSRIYFPDEGSAALARRDWLGGQGGEVKVPACVEISSCGGVQGFNDIKNDMLVFFFCPRASEVESVEEILQRSESVSDGLKLSIFVNPSLVDMGVTGYGFSARLLRERLIDTLETTYYLRTLAWGALTRRFPEAFSVWQEDENTNGGYRLIKTLDRLPSNPEVEDIYDVENGIQTEKQSGGLLDQLGDFVNGMTRL